MTARKQGRFVIALLSTVHKAHRDKLRGIYQHARKAGWHLEVAENNPFGIAVDSVERLNACDGIIVDDDSCRKGLRLDEITVPIVMIDPEGQYSGLFSEVRLDSEATGTLAAETLLAGGNASYAFVSSGPASRWSDERGAAFARRIARAGKTCTIHASDSADEMWNLKQSELAAWLRHLPKPCGVFAAMDLRAKFVLEACRAADIDVPLEVSVLGVDNDEMLCENTFPSLSSIMPDFEGGGRLAAELLDDLMANGVPEKPLFLKYRPSTVVNRGSTRLNQIGCDVRVVHALEYIGREACNGIRVEDVAKSMGISRRMAEALFKSSGRTINESIQAVRLNSVCQMLTSTKLPIGLIASRCGFSSDVYLAGLFKRRFGMTMRAFRNRNTTHPVDA